EQLLDDPEVEFAADDTGRCQHALRGRRELPQAALDPVADALWQLGRPAFARREVREQLDDPQRVAIGLGVDRPGHFLGTGLVAFSRCSGTSRAGTAATCPA